MRLGDGETIHGTGGVAVGDELRRFVVAITARPGVARDLRFCEQARDAARSAPNNIAEGFGRYQHRDFARFLRIAVGSLYETRDHLIDGHARGHVTADELARATALAQRAAAATSSLIRYLMRSPDPEP